MIPDHSEVVAEDLPHHLRLLVHLRPVGSAEVDFRLEAQRSERTRVEITETPTTGPLALAWSPPLAALTRWRNDRVLARLEEVAAGRAEAMARGTSSGSPEATDRPRPAMAPDAGRGAPRG